MSVASATNPDADKPSAEVSSGFAAAPVENRGPEYFGWFDLLRALMALFVFLSHSGVFPGDSVLKPVGGYAVEVFFALSGFLVGGILVRKAQDSERFWKDIPRFYFNRCIRIWVPYFTMVAMFLALVTARSLWNSELLYRLPAVLTYTHNWSVFVHGLSESTQTINLVWSLAVEEQFYLVCPLIVGLCPRRWLIIAIMAVLAVALPLGLGVNYFNAIAMGVLAACVYQMVDYTKWLKITYVALPIGVAMLVYAMLLGQKRGELLTSFGALLVVVGCARLRPSGKLMLLLGAMSYSFYLYHWIGLYVANPISKVMPGIARPVTYQLVSFGISCAMSYASVKLVERPLIARRNGLADASPGLVKVMMWVAWLSMLAGLAWVFLVAPPSS